MATGIGEKMFEGYLILDWKTGKMAVKSRKPKLVGPYKIPIKVELRVTIPDRQELSVRGEVEVAQSKVKDIIFESI